MRSVLLILLLLAPCNAVAKDVNVLIRVLYAAFFVEQGAAICSVPRVQLSTDDKILFINTKNYAAWIKQRITSDLPPEEVINILRAAADRARTELSEIIKVFKSYPPDREYAELSQWCTTKMTAAADRVLRAYTDERKKIDGLIDDAKKD